MRQTFFSIRSALGEEKKLSMAALFQTLPDRLIEQVKPLSTISYWNCSLVYWAIMVSLADRPTTLPENGSITVSK